MLVFKLPALVELILVVLENSGHAYLKRKLPRAWMRRFRTSSNKPASAISRINAVLCEYVRAHRGAG